MSATTEGTPAAEDPYRGTQTRLGQFTKLEDFYQGLGIEPPEEIESPKIQEAETKARTPARGIKLGHFTCLYH